jgi:hypothetical protein
MPSRADTLREQIEHSLWTTTEINRPTAFLHVNSVEQPSRFLSKLLCLSFEPSFFVVTVKEHQDGRREMGLRTCGQGPNALGERNGDGILAEA